MTKEGPKEPIQGGTPLVRFGSSFYTFGGGDGHLFVPTDSPIDVNTPKYGIGEQLKDGSIYVGPSAATGKPLVTTAADIGIFNHMDAVRVVAELDRHGGGGWRLPMGHWNTEGDELTANLFENRNKGTLAGTFNIAGMYPAGEYWGTEHYRGSAECRNFHYGDGGGSHNYFRTYSANVRPVRELAP